FKQRYLLKKHHAASAQRQGNISSDSDLRTQGRPDRHTVLLCDCGTRLDDLRVRERKIQSRRVTRSSTAAAQAADAMTVSRPPPSPAATSTAARTIADRSRPTSTSSRPTSTSSRSTSTSSRSTAASSRSTATSSRSTTTSSRPTATSSRPTATNSNSTATNSSSTAASSRSASTSSRLRTAGLAVAASSNLNTTDRPTNAPRGRGNLDLRLSSSTG
ncbi:unnamed protein product, partial [Nesidiocoris tenuis]